MSTPHLLFVRDAGGVLRGVQLSPELWERVGASVRAAADAMEADGREAAEPLEDFRVLMQHWDFRYPYDPGVSCPCCGASTADWREDPAHPFQLHTANIGGLLVFHCRKCRATIRQKHFRDHRALEHTPWRP